MYFTKEEFQKKYSDYQIPNDWEIEAVCEMILSQVGLSLRQEWDAQTVPDAIKKASMEQMRFMYDHDIPFVDSKKNSDYSTLALRYLANGGYLYRGTPLMSNMSLNMMWGDN